MKKITLLLLLFLSVSYSVYSQNVIDEEPIKIILLKDRLLSDEQKNFLTNVHSVYPDLIVPKTINNYCKNNQVRTLKESVYYSTEQHDYNMYNIVVQPNNKSLHFQYVSTVLPDCGFIGEVYQIDNDIFKLENSFCGKYKTTRLYLNGKIVYSNSLENEASN